MSYNESLNPNSNYPAMSQSQWDNAPWNEPTIPDMDFEVTCSQTLSRTVTVTTNNYVLRALGVDYEPDGEGGYDACGYQDSADTSDTNWSNEYASNGHKTPLELIQLFKETLEQQLESWEGMEDEPYAKKEIHRIKYLIDECKGWTEDETEVIIEE